MNQFWNPSAGEQLPAFFEDGLRSEGDAAQLVAIRGDPEEGAAFGRGRQFGGELPDRSAGDLGEAEAQQQAAGQRENRGGIMFQECWVMEGSVSRSATGVGGGGEEFRKTAEKSLAVGFGMSMGVFFPKEELF